MKNELLKVSSQYKGKQLNDGLQYGTELLFVTWIVLSFSLCSGMFIENPV